MGFMDENRLTLYDGLIKTHITNTTVAKEDGKGLSSNDYTTPEKSIVSKLGESDDNNLTFNGKKISAAQMTGATAEADGTSGTVTAPKAGDQAKFLRGDGTWAEVTGGTKISPKATVNPAITSGNAKCTITWGDPEDVIADGVILSTWKGTKLVMNETGYPQDENDGTVLIDNKVKDAYVSTGYEVTGLTNGKTYYFKLFPYSTDDIYNYQDTNKLLGNPSLVKLDPCTNMNVTVAMGSATVSWTDPTATKTVGGITATWAKTVLVYKQGSTAPVSISDGTVAVEESTQNQYSIDGFEVTGLTNGQEYTFALFAVSTEGSSSDAVSTSVQLWATLNITTTEETLYGKNVTATNDVSTVTGTFSESGSVALNIPWIGTTTIVATDGTDTGDDAINIEAYMNTYSLQFTFVPDGATVTPTDDVAILLKCAEVKGTGYTTIEEVLADDNAMYEITLHEESMKYLARSTGFADAVCANETFMTYLGSSAYVNNTVLNSDLWVEKLKASPYKMQVSPYQVCAYSTASYDDLSSMLTGYYSGWLNIDDIKTKNSVGDTRSVELTAMEATGVGESHRAQTVEFVIGDFEHDDLTTSINGRTKALLTLLQKDCLMDATSASNSNNGSADTEKGYMNSSNTNSGGWKSCARRTWCNNVYYNALSSAIKSLVKSVNKTSGTGGGSSSGTEITEDKIFLAAEIEVFGSTYKSVSGEGSQYEFYKTASNRYKNPKWSSSNVSHLWWGRSPISGSSNGFCNTDGNGNKDYHNASDAYGVVTCLCI